MQSPPRSLPHNSAGDPGKMRPKKRLSLPPAIPNPTTLLTDETILLKRDECAAEILVILLHQLDVVSLRDRPKRHRRAVIGERRRVMIVFVVDVAIVVYKRLVDFRLYITSKHNDGGGEVDRRVRRRIAAAN